MIEILRETDIFRIAIAGENVLGAYPGNPILTAKDKLVEDLIEPWDFDLSSLDETPTSPSLQDALVAQYELTDGSYLVVVDKTRDNVRPLTKLGRLVISRSKLEIKAVSPELHLQRMRWLLLFHARWERPHGKADAYIEQSLIVESVEQISPRLLSMRLRNGKEYRIRFFKKRPQIEPFDLAGVLGDVMEYGLNRPHPIPYFIYRRYTFRWKSLKEFLADVFDFLIAFPLRFWEAFPK